MTSPRDASRTAISNFIQSASPPRILVLFGTRPEAIKLCPVIRELKRFKSDIRTTVCVTGQHRSMLDQVLDAFALRPDIDLGLMRPGQSLSELTARLMQSLEPVFAEVSPDLTIVQGDTTTTFCGALSSFYWRVPVAHVEAGLRTGDLAAPFPEEANRVFTSRLAALHFAPTAEAAENLHREGVSADAIQVTGNTGIDAVLQVRDRLEEDYCEPPIPLDPGRMLILVTAHRRESFGSGFDKICRAVALLADRPDVQIAWPVHPNPKVQESVNRHLRSHSNVTLTDPLPYIDFVDLMRRATLVLTDSGGVQEEAPSLGKPVLVIRDTTERREAVQAGTALLVGTDIDRILHDCQRLLDNPEEREAMSRIHNPYGDGRASQRIVAGVLAFLARQQASRCNT